MPKEHKPKSPLGAPALPTSVENSYRQKCLELKKRIREIEDSNDVLVLRIQRSRRGIQRARLERAFLLQQLEDRTDARVDDSEGSPSPPPTVGATTIAANAAAAVAAAAAMSDAMSHGPAGSSLLLPKEKPLRVKRARKDVPDQPSSRQHSPSPPREVHPMSSYQSTFATVNPATESTGHGLTAHTTASKKGGSRAPRGPKRPPNAYMIFCEKERNNIRKEFEHVEDFDLHKVLAKRWRDLGHPGQKKYFDEYERNKERYRLECEELGLIPGVPAGAAPSHGKRGPRAASVGSSVAPTPAEAEAASPQEPENDEMEDAAAGGSAAGGFTAVNR